MKRRKILSLIGLAALLFVIYYFYLAKPTDFAKTDTYKRYSEVYEVLDIIELDERRIFVPVVTEENKYGMSLWVWKNHKWHMEFESTSGGPRVIKLKNNDPGSYKVFWNIHPDDQVSYGEFYLLRKRNYHITEGIDHYYPQLQMKTILDFKEAPYGMTDLPKEWQKAMEASIKLEEAKRPEPIFENMFPVMQDVYFGWIPYNHEHVRQHARATHVGGASWGGGVDIQHVGDIHEEELEYFKIEE
ncbi:hypothetical protein [Fredinandcohnia onubensis]|uniref:hypothetical protein n=1 Tax=Fredinandcohnia onubensis TaxID=1571209 RepID=UPI000C0BE83C|nr:hypothetical protein [Fredinandcohnia onubensis]